MTDTEQRKPLELGTLVATPGALDFGNYHHVDLLLLLRHHMTQKDNEPEEGRRVVSSYPLTYGTVMIITEADRSATTIMMKEEY